MNKNQGTFLRHEIKYKLSEHQYGCLMKVFEGKIELDPYGEVDICNIYFDTENKLLIRNSIEKPIYKEKLRLRSYGVPSLDSKVFIELKKKYDGVVYKRRIQLELSEAKEYLYNNKYFNYKNTNNININSSCSNYISLSNSLSARDMQIKRELDWFMQYYNRISGPIIPSMYISYNRIAMQGVDDKELRVTFDRNIRWREDDLYLNAGIYGNNLLEDGIHLMEIKINGAMPLWLSNALDQLDIYPSSFSKYGKAYEASMMQSIEENIEGKLNRDIGIIEDYSSLKDRKKGEIKYA